MNLSKIEGRLSLSARAQSLADLQGRNWYVVVAPSGDVFATSEPLSYSDVSVASKLIPSPPSA